MSSVGMSNAFRFKDQIPKCLNSMQLYKFTCNTCNSVYIGKTKRHYLVRQFEHLGLSVFTNKALKYSDKDATAIRKHCHHQNHVNCTDNFKIMGNSVNNYFLQLKESLLILKLKPSLNVAKESMPLYLLDNDFQIQLGFYNFIHDNKRFNDLLLEFVICQCSNSA